MDLKGKTVLVTGSSRGIGKAIAFAFAKRGCNVILNASKSSNELISTQDELKKLGHYSYSYLTDVSDYNAVKDMIDKIHSVYGKIDILVNNAGISSIGLFTDTTPEEWDNVIKTNLYSVYNCTHAILPKMINKKNGIIINISSIWGNDGASCEVAYSASKGAINTFTKALAKEVGPSNIRVNAIACGVIETEMNKWLSEEDKNSLTDQISLMRFGKAEDIANLAVVLAEDRSNFITGQIITIDGGM